MKIDGPTLSFIEILHRLGQFVISSNTSQLLNGSSFFNVTQQSIEHKLVLEHFENHRIVPRSNWSKLIDALISEIARGVTIHKSCRKHYIKS